MSPLVAECAGLWRRTLLIDTDGSRDTTSDVRWLQGDSLFVDLRGPDEGFAGRLGKRDDIFEWTRLIDLQAPGLPDAGRMSWQGDILIEVGVHADYTEHWRRDVPPAGPGFGLLLSGPSGACGVLVRVGEQFGWARRSGRGAEISLGVVDSDSWRITQSADPGRVGADLRPHLTSAHLRVDDDVTWTVVEQEGRVTLP